jgi:hypothetical protein
MRSRITGVLAVLAAGAVAGAVYQLGRARAVAKPAAPAAPAAAAPARPAPPVPRLDWQALAAQRIEREVVGLHDLPAVSVYLDQLLAEAEKAGRLTPLQTTVGFAAIEGLDELPDQERSRLRSDFERRLLELQKQLPPQPPLEHPPPPSPGSAGVP